MNERVVELLMPKNCRVMDNSVMWVKHKPDYDKHPAYSNEVASSTLVQKAKALLYFFTTLPVLLLKRVIQYERISYDLRHPKTVKHVLGLILNVVNNIARFGRKNLRADNKSVISSTLEKYGCCVVSLSPEDFSSIAEVSVEDFNRLANERKKTISEAGREFGESRASCDTDGELTGVISRIWADLGIVDSVSTHLGKTSRVVDVNPQINDRSDSFWANIFSDLGLEELPETAYFHRDASGGDLKAILYMTDVGEENGPFTYVLGSHKMNVSLVDDLIMEANDNNGLSGNGPKERSLFSALPAKLRQKGSFGNDLSNEDVLTQIIRECSWSICAPKGAVIIFDTKGIHRGGMVTEAERRVITTVIG